jgi:AraC-like DNA-binding protein
MGQITNRVIELSQVLGAAVRQLHERLICAAGIDAMAQLTEDFLREWLPRARPFHPIQLAASRVIARHGEIKIHDLAREAELSERQLERKFVEQVGIPPKLYGRISRLDYALRLKEAKPQRTWTELTFLSGYFDQNHMVKDFKALAGTVPSEFFRLIEEGFQPKRAVDTTPMSVSY